MSKESFTLDPELIVDREVVQTNEDKLGHEQIATQLERLVCSVPAPSNIALYGAWGSGKSGVANLLATKLEGKKGIRFVRFDAFKYAENPLRRNFISATATALKVTRSKFNEDLYSGRTTADYGIPGASIRKIGVAFLCILFFCAILVFGIAALVAIFQAGGFWIEFGNMAKAAGTAALLPATLFTAIVAFVGKTFVVEKKLEKADSDEQFERLFHELITEAKVKRLVVFVDELDRCTPAEIVSTLDAVRTFLGVDKCVFVIATDQQVLEQALTHSLKQATPTDTVNPYYSSGSAYLDKVFQYQISIPPLLPQSVTRFAADLVRNRPGVWSELDIDLIVSVLIPSHVRSPRRVKTLLNAFVTEYRLAIMRQQSSMLSTDITCRADEVARLVCLRVEFPLFAHHLLADAKLPDYILHRLDHPDDGWSAYPNLQESIKKLVERYTSLEQPVDQILSSDTNEKEDSKLGELNGAQRERLVQKQGQQLLDYLSRTRSVQGPKRDLVHLQSSGNVFGLDGALADSVDQDAQNGTLKRLRVTFEPLSKEDRVAVVSFLIQQLRSAIGIEADNIARSILNLIAVDREVLKDRADSFIEALASVLPRVSEIVDEETLPGAWRLALASERTGAVGLRAHVLQHVALEQKIELFSYVLRDASIGLKSNAERMVGLTVRYLISDVHRSFVESLNSSLTIENSRPLILAIEKQLSTALTSAMQEYDKTQVAEPSAQAAADDESEDVFDPTPVVDSLGLWIDYLCEASNDAYEVLIRVILAVDKQHSRDIIESRLTTIGTVNSPLTARVILKSTNRRLVRLWPKWLAVLDDRVMSDEHVVGALNDLGKRLWDQVTDGKPAPEPSDVRKSASLIADLLSAADDASFASIEPLNINLGPTPDTAADVVRRRELIQFADQFVIAGLVKAATVVDIERQAVIEILEKDLSTDEVDTELIEYVSETAFRILEGWTGTESKLGDDASHELIRVIDRCSWLSAYDSLLLRLRSRIPFGDLPVELLIDPPSADEVISALKQFDGDAISLGCSWIQIAEPNAVEIYRFCDSYPSATASPKLLNAIQSRRKKLSMSEQEHLLTVFIGDVDGPHFPELLLRAIGLLEVSPVFISNLLAKRYSASMNNMQRKRVLELWRSAQISSTAAKKLLIEEVLIPLAKLNAEGKNASAATLVVDFLPDLLSSVPSGVKRDLGKAVVAATSNSRLESKALNALEKLGYALKPKGFLRLGRKLSESDD